MHFTVICCMNKCIINERYIPEHQNKLNIYDLQNYEFFSTEKKFVKFEFSIYADRCFLPSTGDLTGIPLFLLLNSFQSALSRWHINFPIH